jgi:hypothetical protein
MVSAKRKRLIKLLLLKQAQSRSKKRYWVHPLLQNRQLDGEHVKLDEMLNKYGERFREYTRMSPNTFRKLLSIVGSTLERKDTNLRKAIPVHVRLYIILRYP